MAILLLILKVLLMILAALLFLLLYILFLPFRIHCKFVKKDKEIIVNYKASTFLQSIYSKGEFSEGKLTHREGLFWGLISLELDNNKKDIQKDKNKKKRKKPVNFSKIRNKLNMKTAQDMFRMLNYICKVNRFSIKKLNLEYAFEEPDTTGMLSGAIAVLPLVYCCKPDIFPDFDSEKPYFDVDTEIDVNFFLFTLLVVFIKMI